MASAHKPRMSSSDEKIPIKNKTRKVLLSQSARYVRKTSRSSGQPYISARKQPVPGKLPPSEGTICKCSFRCKEVDFEEKMKLFTDFHALDYNEQSRFFSSNCVKIGNVLRRYTDKGTSRRHCTVFYFVPRKDEDVRVCKKTFCDIFKVTERRLSLLIDKIKFGRPVEDHRGIHSNRPNKVSYEVPDLIKSNISSFPKQYVSKHHNSTMDADDSDYDQEGEIGDEEEQNYDSSNNLGVAIKIEPGLGDEDSISEDFPIKEEVRDPLDDMLDIDVSTSIKQENDYIDQNCAITEIRIKTEPNFSDDDIHDDSSQNYSKDSNEGCSQAELQKAVNADKDQEINNVGTVSKNTNGRDENQVFGDFIAGELRNLKSEENRKKLKSIIQNVMNEMSGTQE